MAGSFAKIFAIHEVSSDGFLPSVFRIPGSAFL
jgi:hypothetical protein